MDWKRLGNCHGEDPGIFFPISNQSDRKAKKLCKECPVQGQCLDEALTFNELGVWGGTNERERRRIKRRYIPGTSGPKDLVAYVAVMKGSA